VGEEGTESLGLTVVDFEVYVCSKPIRSVVSAGDCLLIRKVFDSFDTDNSNLLSRDEMETCMVKVLGLPRESPRVQRVIQLANQMCAGEDDVDFIKFFEILVEGNVLSDSRMMAVTNLFRLIDFDGSGSLTSAEISTVLIAAQMSDATIAALLMAFGVLPKRCATMEEIFQRGSGGGSGGAAGGVEREVNLNTFIEVVNKADDGEVPGAEEFQLSKLIKVKQAFTNIDRDGSGSVSLREFRRMMDLLKIEMTDEEVEALIAEIDEDGDAEINFKEYLVAVSKGVFTNKNAGELFDISQISEMSTYLLSNDPDTEETVAPKEDMALNILERICFPMITSIYTRKPGRGVVSGVFNGGLGISVPSNKVEPMQKISRADTRADTKGVQHSRPISDKQLAAVKRTRILTILSSAFVAFVSAVLSATCDLIAQAYVPIKEGHESDPKHWSLWRFYMAGTIPACVLACVEVGLIYYLVLKCALEFACTVGLVLYPINEERKFMIRSIIQNCFEMPYPNNTVEGINPLRGYSKIRLLMTMFVYRARVGVTTYIVRVLGRRTVARTTAKVQSRG